MGMREVRRLRGELGRTIFYEEEEKGFRALFPRSANLQISKSQSAQPGVGVDEGEVEGDLRWPTELILATAEQARTGRPPTSGLEYRVGRSGGGFDRLRFVFELDEDSCPTFHVSRLTDVDLSLNLNRRNDDRPRLRIPHPWYGAGMSFGSVSLNTMLARARAAQAWDSFTSTGEGGYPDELTPYAEHIITQVATGLFGVREETIQRAPI
ncbi:MAG TPA: hypothetical protein EYH32_03290, partial [Anaerolineae bacterium]|nr:hypothetical protein [Anaerolineae bacterium]